MTPQERDALVKTKLRLEEEAASIARLLEEDARRPPPSAAPEPKRMRRGDYATSRSIPLRTLDDYIVQGLPTAGEGPSRRILVAEADRWLDSRRRRAG